MIPRRKVIEEARTYIGTPFHHQGRLKKAGVDCVGVLVGVARTLGLTDHDVPAYTKYPQGGELMPELEKTLIKISLEDLDYGDVMVFWINRFSRVPQHLALRTDIGMIHTYQSVGKVVEHGLTKKWLRRLCAAFRFPGVGDD